MYSIHPGGNGDGFSLVPPEWCSVPSTPRTRTKSGSLTRGQVVRFAAVVGPVQGALQVAEEHDVVAVDELRVDLQLPLQGPQFGGLRLVTRGRAP